MYLPLASVLIQIFSNFNLRIVMLSKLLLAILKRACSASDLLVLLQELIDNRRMHHATTVTSYGQDFSNRGL